MEYETQLAATLQQASDPILIFDSEGCISFLNFTAQQLFKDPEVKPGQRLHTGAGYDAFLELMASSGGVGILSGEVVWPDNRVFASSITAAPQGGCLVVLHDVSRYKEQEKVKNEFIATASHDLRSPITSIKGFNVLM